MADLCILLIIPPSIHACSSIYSNYIYFVQIDLPGSSHLYSSHGWTLVSAVMEGASGQKFPQIISKLFRDLGLEHTCLDLHQPIIYNRAR